MAKRPKKSTTRAKTTYKRKTTTKRKTTRRKPKKDFLDKLLDW